MTISFGSYIEPTCQGLNVPGGWVDEVLPSAICWPGSLLFSISSVLSSANNSSTFLPSRFILGTLPPMSLSIAHGQSGHWEGLSNSRDLYANKFSPSWNSAFQREMGSIYPISRGSWLMFALHMRMIRMTKNKEYHPRWFSVLPTCLPDRWNSPHPPLKKSSYTKQFKNML